MCSWRTVCKEELKRSLVDTSLHKIAGDKSIIIEEKNIAEKNTAISVAELILSESMARMRSQDSDLMSVEIVK